LRREVESLLASHEQAGTWALTPSSALGFDSEDDGRLQALAEVIDHYHLLQKIGQGGMGEVWLAEQKEPMRRRVALKLVKRGLNTREVIARFGSERQVLALMDHPTIARVFDAGCTSQGAPYFVMEYVPGLPITDYCDNHKLSIRERLELFMHVCEGVHHAHQKAIIHRDLKPSNILVTEVDGGATPKIIDFGVAKALTQKLTEDTLFTHVGTLLGTPEYMSPEQANSSGEDIDTRTDVYSLGVIFYELLAGALPLDLGKSSLEEFLRRLREEEPPKPSTKIRTHDAATSSELARKRETEPLALAKQICGDLDWIALKTLEKERSRRYGSASELAADIGRYLKNEAVLAVPASAAYRARKFARRYRVTLATAAAFALVLIAAAGLIIRQSIRANTEAAMAKAVDDFLRNDLLAQASAAKQSGQSVRPDPDLKVRTVLDRAAARIAGKFDRQPEVEAAIRDTIGETYVDLGLYPEGRKHLERALELHRVASGTKNTGTLNTMTRLGQVENLQGRYAEAETLFSQAFEIQRRVLGPQHPDTLKSMTNLATVYDSQGKYPQAAALDKQTLDIEQRVLGPEHPNTLVTMNNLGLDYDAVGKYAEAETLQREVLEIQRRVAGPEHPNTLGYMNNLALSYYQQGKYAQSEALHSQSLDIRRRVLGPEHPQTLRSLSNLGLDYLAEGKYEQAEALETQAMEIRPTVLGPEHPETVQGMAVLAVTYASEGKYAPAEELFSKTVEIGRRVLGAEHPTTLSFFKEFASMYQRQGRYALAETYAAQALAGRRRALSVEDPDTIASALDLALAYQSQGKFAESEPLAREALEFNRKKQPDDWQRFRAESLLGASLAGQQKYADAEPLLLEGYTGMVARQDRIAVPDRYHLDRAHGWIVELYEGWGKPEKAAEWKKK
jgi:serine/threonine protein kinase/Tfp pilus assembly protein PilF